MNKSKKMIELFSTGKTLQEIGDIFFVSRQRVQQILKIYGITRKHGGYCLSSKKNREKKEAERQQRYLAKYGLSFDETRKLAKSGITRRYKEHRLNAKRRGIGWRLTLGDWWRAWKESGYLDRRGAGKGYCMARKEDTGPYAIGNIYFCTVGENVSDSYKFKPYRERKKRLDRV